MGVSVRVGDDVRELGAGSFLHAFFSTISCHLEPLGWGSRFPVLMNHLYQGEIPPSLVEAATAELAQVREELERLPPSAVVWDIQDLSARPPWGEEIDPRIASLAEYFVTTNGQDLFGVLCESLAEAEDQGVAVSIG